MRKTGKKNYHSHGRQEMTRFLPRSFNKVLEIGCGTGSFFGNIADTDGIEIWGVELEAEAAKVAALNGYKVLVGDFETVLDELPDRYFDLVVCNDVIEHFPDSGKLLSAIRQKMAKSAHLVGSIPNVRYIENLFELLVLKDWKYKGSGILDRTHLRFFTRKSIVNMFIDNDFSLKRIDGINSIFVPMRSVRRIWMGGIALILLVITLGYYRDSLYLQYGFQSVDISTHD